MDKAPMERLEPCLLDRLTDSEPAKQREEGARHRTVSWSDLRKSVMRDLSWLLNTTRLESDRDLDEYPEIAKSVLNYGIPELSGRNLHDMDPGELERTIRTVILHYEPRLLPKTLKVRLRQSMGSFSDNALLFEIEGELWARPVPMHLLISSRLDLEDGNVTFESSTGSDIG